MLKRSVEMRGGAELCHSLTVNLLKLLVIILLNAVIRNIGDRRFGDIGASLFRFSVL